MERLPQLGLYRIATGTALILAPALLLLDNLLHPEELERGNEGEQVGLIADAYTRWQVAHAIGFVAILVFCAALLGLAFLVRRRQPLLGLAGGLLGVVGLLGFAAAITIDGFTWGVVGVSSADRESELRPPRRPSRSSRSRAGRSCTTSRRSGSSPAC